jgi:hypothetical protein
MARYLVLMLVLAVPSVSLHSGEPLKPLHSRFAVTQDLFGRADVVPGSFVVTYEHLLQEQERKKKSVGLAAIYSLLLPGLGEMYADGFSTGKYFLVAEGVLWLTYAAFDIHGNALRDDARAFAISRAGIDPAGKGDQYYVDVGNYLNIEEFNIQKARDREPDRMYPERAGYDWYWRSDNDRSAYRDQRISAENMFNNRKFVVAAVLINHVASAINAARSAVSYNNRLDEQSGELGFKAELLGGLFHPHGVMLTVSKGF